MCIFCGNSGRLHDFGSVAATFYAGADGSGSNAAAAATPPPGSAAEIAYLNGLTSTNQVAATSFWTWNYNNSATYSNTSWASKWGSSTPGTSGGTVTYWFDTASAWTATEKAALESGLALWSALANINFSLAANAGSANFIFYENSSGSAYESAPQSTTSVGSNFTGSHSSTGAVISIDTDVAGFGPIGASFGTYGGYPWHTLLHEIGHLIGLGHGGPYNGNVNAATQQFSAYDTRLWTIMSYINPSTTSAKYYSSYPVTGTNWGVSADGYWNVPTTMMILDILAAQQLYGVPTSGPLASGGQVFGFNSNIAGSIHNFFDFTVNTKPVITIWDGGLNNTLDLSGWNTASTINLNPGTFSSANGMMNNIGIAAGTVIETAIGGGGNDTIVGSSANNTLRGNGGNDNLSGGQGNDTLYGGVGIDTANGGAGWDQAVFGVASTNATIVHNANGTTTVTYAGGSETLTNVEVLKFTNTSVAARATTPNDFLADNTSDVLFWNDSTGDIGSYAINTNGVYAGWNSIGNASTAYSPVGTGDFNGDGTSDVLLRNNTTGHTGFYQISNGAMAEWHSIAGSSPAYNVVGVGDFNGDGTSDILFRNNSTGDTGFYQISDGALQGWHWIGGSSTAYTVVGVGDFNGDAVSDVLFRNNATGDTGFYQLNTDGSFQGWHWIGGSSAAYSVEGIGDFNGDGTSDILFRNNSTGDTGFYQINNGALTGWHSIGGSSSAYSVAAVGDFSGDGTSDILFRNDTTGDTGFYQISNGAFASWHWVGGSNVDFFVV